MRPAVRWSSHKLDEIERPPPRIPSQLLQEVPKVCQTSDLEFLWALWLPRGFRYCQCPEAPEMCTVMRVVPHSSLCHSLPYNSAHWGLGNVAPGYCLPVLLQVSFPEDGQKLLRIRLETIQLHSKSPFLSEDLFLSMGIDWHRTSFLKFLGSRAFKLSALRSFKRLFVKLCISLCIIKSTSEHVVQRIYFITTSSFFKYFSSKSWSCRFASFRSDVIHYKMREQNIWPK